MFFCKIQLNIDIWKQQYSNPAYMKKTLLAVSFCLATIISFAQKSKIKLGDVKPEDFVSVYSIDSSAEAVVLKHYGNAKFEGNNQGYFNVVYTIHKKIRLLNKNMFGLATVTIPIYVGRTNGEEERLEKLEAVTYNLENGKVVSTKLEKSSMFKEKVNNVYEIQKFTFPNIKEGAIIEYAYTISSPYPSQLRDWQFQEGVPVLWSEYDITVPEIFDYVIKKQGYHPFKIDTVSVSLENYSILNPGTTASQSSSVYNMKSNTYHSIWAMENIPALKQENYTTTLKNHIAKIDFQLAAYRYPDQPVKPVTQSWHQAAERLLQHENFGADLKNRNGWISDLVEKEVSGIKDPIAKAKKIFEYVRDNFSCTDHSAFYLSSPLKKIAQSKSGSVAELNMLLTAIYRNQGFVAHPVILSTTDNGKAYDMYPLLDQYNYLVCQLTIDSTKYLLDATHKRLGFNKLPSECYNGSARLIDDNPLIVKLEPTDINETEVTNIYIAKDDKGALKGSYSSAVGYYESLDIRERLVRSSKEEFFRNIKKSYPIEVEVENTELDGLKSYEDNITVKYDFKLALGDEDIIYFNPMLNKAYKTNPFKSVNRYYPVEMSYPLHETYVLTMDVPEGYKADELPKSVRVKYNEDEGMFEYIIKEQDGVIQMRCKITLDKAVFMPEEYESLRSFFAYIVKKQSEQIVFKKIK